MLIPEQDDGAHGQMLAIISRRFSVADLMGRLPVSATVLTVSCYHLSSASVPANVINLPKETTLRGTCATGCGQYVVLRAVYRRAEPGKICA